MLFFFIIFLQAFSIGLLVTAVIGLTAIGPFEDIANERGIDFEDADSYRGAAGWLVFLGSAVTLYHIVMIIISVVHLVYYRSALKKYIKSRYAIIVGDHIIALCISDNITIITLLDMYFIIVYIICMNHGSYIFNKYNMPLVIFNKSLYAPHPRSSKVH